MRAGIMICSPVAGLRLTTKPGLVADGMVNDDGVLPTAPQHGDYVSGYHLQGPRVANNPVNGVNGVPLFFFFLHIFSSLFCVPSNT